MEQDKISLPTSESNYIDENAIKKGLSYKDAAKDLFVHGLYQYPPNNTNNSNTFKVHLDNALSKGSLIKKNSSMYVVKS